MTQGAKAGVDEPVAGERLSVQAGTPARGEYRCASCGYGVIVQTTLPRCPMCGAESWRPDTGARSHGRSGSELS
jgi:rubrerythrin